MTYNRFIQATVLLLFIVATPSILQARQSSHATAGTTVVDTPPEGSTAYYELNIRDRFKNLNWEGGKKLLDEAIKKYPQMSAFHELMGRYYMHHGSEALKASQNNNEAKEFSARKARQATAYYDKARYYLIRAISIDEKNVQARFHMLQVETDTKHYSSAIVYCNDLLEENPYNEDLWRKKIDLNRKLGNNAEADRLLERLYTIYPSDDQIRQDLVDRKTIKARKQRDNGDAKGQEETLRQLLEIDSKNAANYHALANLLYRSGRVAEAAEVEGQGAAMTNRTDFVEKRASMLCEMNRHREAVEYVKAHMARTGNNSLSSLVKDLDIEAARAAQYNDAYIAYAKIYESQHSAEALDYLVNTSIERWYLDDALQYIKESLRVKGESKKMLYNQYIVNKRLGNTRKANALLTDLYNRYPDDETISEDMMLLLLDDSKELMDQGMYSEAVPMLEKVFNSKAYPYLRDAAAQRLYNCYFQARQYPKAEKLLSQMDSSKRIAQTATLYNAWGKTKEALDFLSREYHACPDSASTMRNLISYTYEEIALPYVKNLLINNKVNEACRVLEEALTICPDNTDLLRYAITASQRKGDIEAVTKYIARGRNRYPNDPYFILKDAQIRRLSGNHKAMYDEIVQLLDDYPGDSLLISLYVESIIEIAQEYLKDKQPEEALQVVQSALRFAPDNSELYYYQGVAYEHLKEWDNAYKSFLKYKPGYAEVSEYHHHLEQILNHKLNNSISLEYQQARPGSEDVISGNAYINYAHKFSTRNTLYAGMAYAGRDGSTKQSDTEMTRGGVGVQLSGGWEHSFNNRLSGKIEAAIASRYFPILMARLSGSYLFDKEWTLSLFASYRMLRAYTGVYGWEKPVIGYDKTTDKPIYGDAEYIRKGWHEAKRSMLQAGANLSKTLGQFNLSGEVSGMYFTRSLYFNTNFKMQFFPQEGNATHIFAVGGVGTAPESSLIDRSMPVGFKDLNSFVGLGGSYFANRWLTFGLAGTWYTMLLQSERLETTYTVNDPYIRDDYRNYFYLHASVKISF